MRAHGQLSVFIGVLIEQVIVPIPSPMIVMGAGAILISPDLSIPNGILKILWIIVLPGTIASTLGSYIGYTISYYGGKALVIRFERFLGVDWGQIEKLEKRFQGKKVAWSLILARAIPAFPLSLVSVFAGLLRIPIRPFTLYTFLGSIIRILLLSFIGWWVGATYEKVASHLDSLETIISVLMLIAMGGILGYLYYKIRKKG
jgi:membrane protein DedA with SNARE-associated domain